MFLSKMFDFLENLLTFSIKIIFTFNNNQYLTHIWLFLRRETTKFQEFWI